MISSRPSSTCLTIQLTTDQMRSASHRASVRRCPVRCHSDLVSNTLDPDFYVTCATVIPVLFLAAAVQTGSDDTIYDSIVKTWRKADQAAGPPIALRAGHATLNTLQKALQGVLEDAVDAGQAAVQEAQQAQLGVPPTAQAAEPTKRWRRMRIAAATVASVFLPAIASVIVFAGVIGEVVAIYVLYKGSEQPEQRQLVFVATVILVIAVAARPFLTFILLFFRPIISLPKQYFFLIREAFLVLKRAVSRFKQLLFSENKATGENGSEQDGPN